MLKTQALLDALRAGNFDAAFGGARRDEEKSRAKERIYSLRDTFGQWDPKNQRPELWNIFNGRINPGESMRVFPLSNWTELDVWQYIHAEKIPIVPDLYFAKEREMLVRGNSLIMPEQSFMGPMLPGEKLARPFGAHAVAGLLAVHGCGGIGCRHDSKDYRGAGGRQEIRTRESRD